jgi:serine/threonine protein kinase
MQHIQHYTLSDKVLGEGGYCVAKRATDTIKNTTVCIKLFKNDEPNSHEMFENEVRYAQLRLKHANILRILGAGSDSVNYVVTELAQG